MHTAPVVQGRLKLLVDNLSILKQSGCHQRFENVSTQDTFQVLKVIAVRIHFEAYDTPTILGQDTVSPKLSTEVQCDIGHNDHKLRFRVLTSLTGQSVQGLQMSVRRWMNHQQYIGYHKLTPINQLRTWKIF